MANTPIGGLKATPGKGLRPVELENWQDQQRAASLHIRDRIKHDLAPLGAAIIVFMLAVNVGVFLLRTDGGRRLAATSCLSQLTATGQSSQRIRYVSSAWRNGRRTATAVLARGAGFDTCR